MLNQLVYRQDLSMKLKCLVLRQACLKIHFIIFERLEVILKYAQALQAFLCI